MNQVPSRPQPFGQLALPPDLATGCTSLLGEGRTVEIDVKGNDLAIPYSKYFGYIALEHWRSRPLQLVSSQGARFVPVNQQISYFERDNPTIEAFRGFEVCPFS